MRAFRRFTCAVSMLAATASPAAAFEFEMERNFAGSAQLDYLAVPTAEPGRGITLDGFTTELSMKVAVDFNENISANVKVCFGCHGFETDMAFVDLRVADELNFRVGRMNPAFGDFPLRHDPANHKTSSKPLPYDMGRMLRLREWNMSVLPSPYVDNGLEVNGTHWFGDDLQVDYAAYIVSGFKGGNDGQDFDFIQSRSGSLYYVDNNSEPAAGGRLSFTANFGDEVTSTLGASAMWGRYDPDTELEYIILGADLYLRIYELTLRAEYLLRRTEYALGAEPEARFRYGLDPARNFFIKDGFYIEAEVPVLPRLDIIARWDGMRRFGNVPTTSPLRSESQILRYLLGLNVGVARGMRIKLSGEFWDFSDFDDEVAIHLGIVANF